MSTSAFALELPSYQSEHLERSPLVLVAAQVNFEEVDREVSHARARAFQRAAGPQWAVLQVAPLVTTTVTSSGAVSEPARQAYRISTKDDTWSAVLNPSSVTVETRSYPGWDGMKRVLSELTHAIAEVYDPANELRLGLRYVDQIPLPDDRESWRGLIPDALLGLAVDPRLEMGVLASDQRVLLQLDPEVRCLFRHGLLANEKGEYGKYYLIDYDVFRENAGAFDADQVDGAMEILHEYAGRLFRASVEQTLYDWLKG